MKGVELGYEGQECSFEAILRKYDLMRGPALALLGKIFNGADTDNTLWQQLEGPGLEAIAEGFRQLGFADDHASEQIMLDWPSANRLLRQRRTRGASSACPVAGCRPGDQ